MAEPDVVKLKDCLDQFQARVKKDRRTFGIGLTRKCPVACKHCINDSLPKRHEQLTPQQIRKACEELAKSGEFDTVNFTGGEPFEVYELLCEATSIVSSCGLLPTIVSSASWVTDAQSARNVLIPLANRGLHALIISRDEFHELRVPHPNVANALLEAQALDLTTALNLTTGSGVKSRDELLAPIKQLMGQAAFSQVHINEQGLVRAGRAERLRPEKFGPSKDGPADPLACTVGGPVLLEDGEITACCGPRLRPNSPLRLGHCDVTDAAEMVRTARSDSLIQMIRYLGLQRMAELLGTEVIGTDLKSIVRSARPSDICLVCIRLLAEPERVALLRSLAQEPTVKREMGVRAALLYGDISVLAGKEAERAPSART